MRVHIPSVVTRTIAALQDPEKGQLGSPAQPNTVNTSSRGLDQPSRDAQIEETLTHFRHYVGIHNDPDLNSGRPYANVGIYQRLVKAEKSYNQQYKTYSVLINSALGLQIIFAAALTALGAGNGPRSAVTAFGALNTILAGFLTYLKGSGLPNRLKYYENEMVKVREYIEQREREFARGNTDLDLREEVQTIENMYETVKRDVEINTPEAYVSISNMSVRDSRVPPPSLGARQRSKNNLDDRVYDYEDVMSNPRRMLESRLSQSKLGVESRISELQRGLSSRVNDAQRGLDSRTSELRQGLESRLSNTLTGLERQMTDTREGLTSQYQQAREGVGSQFQQARVGAENEFDRTRTQMSQQYDQSRSALENEYDRTRTQVSQQYDQTRSALENEYDQTRLATQAQVERTRHGIETRIHGTQAQVEDTRHNLEARIQDTERNINTQFEQTRHGLETTVQNTQRDLALQVEQSRHGMESKLQEMQDQVKEQEGKILGIAESVAQKVLSVTQKMHDNH